MNPIAFFKKPMVILVIAIFLLVILIPFAMPGSITAPSLDSVTEKHKGFAGKVINSATVYPTSFKSDGKSGDISAYGVVWGDSTTLASAEKYRLVAYVNEAAYKVFPSTSTNDISTWGAIPDTFVAIEWNTPTWTFNIVGMAVGYLRIEMHVFINDVPIVATDYKGRMGYDTSELKSGEGIIHNYGSQTTFEEGDEAPVFIKTGFTGMGTDGWTVFGYPPASRTDLTTWTVGEYGDNIETVIKIKIQPGWFKVSTNPLDNQFKVELWNHLFSYGWTYIFSIDQYDRMPSTPVITQTHAGNQVTFTIESESTYKDVGTFLVYSYYGGLTMPSPSDSTNWITSPNGVLIPATHGTGTNFTATYINTAKNFAGNIMVKAVAIDVEGRASNTAWFAYEVTDDGSWGKELPPLPHMPFLWNTLAIIIAVLLVLAIIAIAWFAPVDWNIKIILIMIIGIAGAILVWLAGTLQIGG